MEGWLHDISWVLPLRHPVATQVVNAFNFLGELAFMLVFLSAGHWLLRGRLFTRVAVVVMVSFLLNMFLKDLLKGPRPDQMYALTGHLKGSYGPPAGHTQIAVALWSWIALTLARPWAWAGALTLIVGISFSRLYIGVHSLYDIFLGVGVGLVSLPAFYFALREDRLARALRLPSEAWMGLAVVAAAAFWVFWPEGEDPADGVSVLFLLAGWAGGLLLSARTGTAEQRPAGVWQAAVMVAGGVVLLFAIHDGVEAIVGGFDLHGIVPLRWANIALIGFYITGLAPLLFRKLRLAA